MNKIPKTTQEIAKSHPDYVAHKYAEALWKLAEVAELLDHITYDLGFENLDNTVSVHLVTRSLEMNREYAVEFLKNIRKEA